MDGLHDLFPPGKGLEELLTQSVEISKNYIAMLALNFEFEIEINFERDQTQLRAQLNQALELNKKYLLAAKPAPYTGFTVKLQILMLDFYSLMTNDQFNSSKAQAMTAANKKCGRMPN